MVVCYDRRSLHISYFTDGTQKIWLWWNNMLNMSDGEYFVFDNNNKEEVFDGSDFKPFSSIDMDRRKPGMSKRDADDWCGYLNKHINSEHGYQVIDSGELYALKMMDSL